MDVVAPNEWTQIDDGMLHPQMTAGSILAAGTPSSAMPVVGAGSSGTSTAGARAPMERPPPPTQDGQPLRCPRCDSSNTKFCYYNNYSLSQPRHFCKACKRYWTRGGTLRNVPVGGGCRKNKRIKKPHPTTTPSGTSSSSRDPSPPMPPLPFLPNPTAMASASSELGLLLYSLANPATVPCSTTPYETISVPCSTPYDHLQPQLGALGLSFPSNAEESYLPGLKTQTHLSAPATAESSHLQECSLFGSAAASFLASSLKQQQHKLVQNPHPLSPYAGLHPPTASGNLSALLKDVKLEGGDADRIMSSSTHRNMLQWQYFPSCDQNNPMEAIAAESPSLYWNAAAAAFGGGVWPDAASCGSSVAPLI